MKPDTSAEGVEQLAQLLRTDADAPAAARYRPYTDGRMRDAAAMIESLAAERDAAEEMAKAMTVDSQQRLAERDALRAALEAVHRRVQDQTGGRTHYDCSRDLAHADALCRAALGNTP